VNTAVPNPAAEFAPDRGRHGRGRRAKGERLNDERVLRCPQARETFEHSKLDRARGDERLRAFYSELLALRPRLPREVEVEIDDQARTLRARRGEVELVADFANATVELRR
jgi:maltooligosyltrehalose trehalohydrolase